MAFLWSDLELPLIEEPDPLADDGTRELHEHTPRIVTRDDWDAEDVESEDEDRLEDIKDFPVPYMVLTHTRTRPCKDKDDCKLAVKELQRTHLDQGHPDILYNFLIDTEGFIYIGRGPAIHHGVTFHEDVEKMKKTHKKAICVGYIGSGGIEPPELMVQGSASLLSLLMDGKYVDEETAFVWYHHPVQGLPGDEEEKKKKTREFDEMAMDAGTDYAKQYLLDQGREFLADNNL